MTTKAQAATTTPRNGHVKTEQPTPLPELYGQLLDAMAQIVEHPDVPADVFTCITGWMQTFCVEETKANPEVEAAYIRHVGPKLVRIWHNEAAKQNSDDCPLIP